VKYAVKDTLTGDYHGGMTIHEVSKMLDTKTYTLYRAIAAEKKIDSRYLVMSCHEDTDGNNKLPLALLNEWDSVCSKFRQYYGNNMEVNE
jgi:hypothetical protein